MTTSSSIKIAVLDVGDADAIIVSLRRGPDRLVMLIDGGHSRNAGAVITELDRHLADAGKKGPDLVLCTHYDSDHIGGLRDVVNHYKNNIGVFLIHRTSEILDIGNRSPRKAGKILPSENDPVCGSYEFMDTRTEEAIDRVLESIRQERELIAIIRKIGIPSFEPIADKHLIAGWEKEIAIIGPTEAYYRSMFPKNINAEKLLEKEAIALLAENEPNPTIASTDLCTALEILPKTLVSPVNLNSAIIKIEIAGKSFLFTGDAGIPSFQKIPDYANVLKNIFWLKVPHHASRNNINRQLIELMSPRIAVVSGDRYVDDAVIGCLHKQGVQVDITRDVKSTLRYEW